MRAPVFLFLALATVGTVVGILVAQPSFVGVIPLRSEVDLDLERRALRYESARVTVSDGREIAREILLLGPADRILEPWLAVRFGLDGTELVPLAGDAIGVPAGTATALWDAALGAWHFSPERIDPERFPRVRDAGAARPSGGTAPPPPSLPATLRVRAPDRGRLIDRAFPPGGGT